MFRVDLEDAEHNLFGVSLDGVTLPGKLTAYFGRYCYTLAQGLPAGEHRLTLTRLTWLATLKALAATGIRAASRMRAWLASSPASCRKILGW